MYDQSQKAQLWEHPTSLVYEKKFDTALRKTIVMKSKKQIEEVKEEDLPFHIKLLLKNNDRAWILNSQTNNSCMGKVLIKIFDDTEGNVCYGPRKGDQISKIYSLAKKNLTFQHFYMNQQNALPSTVRANIKLQEKLRRMVPTPLIHNLMYVCHRMKLAVDQLGFVRRKMTKDKSDTEKIDELAKDAVWDIPELGLKMSWSMNLCMISLYDGSRYCMPTSYILMIHNKLADILSVMMLAQFQEGICHADGSLGLVETLVKELATLVIKYGDKFASISGSLEGLVIAETLIEVEDWENDDLLNNIVEDISSSINYDYLSSKLRTIILMAPIPLRHELGCLSKVCGHPFVDMEAGAKKLHARTTTHKELTYESVSWVVNKAKETFVKNYIARHGKWPLCEIKMQKPGKDPLLNAMLRNKDPNHPSIEKKYGIVKNIDWARLELSKVMEFHDLENIIPFLKDKSVSVLRNVAVRKYIQHDLDTRAPWEDTRLLLYYLFNPLKKIDHQAFLEQYTQCDDLDLLADYLIIRLVPKEKEHKIAFRGFGVKTYLDRMRNLAQEKNTATFLDLYCDEQAMTMGELEISKRLYATRTILKAYKGHHVLNINFDSSGWNNCFRDETVKPVLRETVSKIMGHECLHKIHEGYENTKFIIPDGDVTYHWDGQQGGIDGLNQYPWVWVYINQIKYAMKEFPVSSHIFCKGDDMRIAVIIRPELLEIHDMKTWHRMIVESVSVTAKTFGHEIKIQESYGSEKYFTFSKASSLGPIEMPQGFRKIQKVYGANNAMISTIDEFVASTFSNAHSACRTMTNTYSAYFVALVWSYYYITHDSHYKELSDNQLVSLLLIPNMLGGFPVIYLHNMSVRAESDLLSPFMDMVKFARNQYPQYYSHLTKFLRVTRKSKIDVRKILKDPYSLWIETPVLPTAVLRSFILAALERQVRNEDIKGLIKATKSSFSRDIVTAIQTAVPFDAKVLSTIYAATPEGVLSELLKKFETGRSILDLIILKQGIKSSERKLRKVIATDYKLQKWRSDKITGHAIKQGSFIVDPHTIECPTQAAQEMRDTTWDRTITGVSMPPLAHQTTLITPEQGRFNAHAKRNHFHYDRNPPVIRIDPDLSDHWTSGDLKPFLGFRTRTGNISPTVSFQDKDPLIIKVKNLLDLLSWVSRSKTDQQGNVITSNLPDLIKLILSMYTELSQEDLAPFSCTRKSGTIQHHARAPRFKESIVPNILSNSYQNIKGTSDTHITLRTSDQHYTVNFLHVLCSATHLSQIELEVDPHLTTPHVFWSVTTDCKYCNTPIEEAPIIISDIPSFQEGVNILNSCRLDNISKSMILKSYQEFSDSVFKGVNDNCEPSLILARVAVAQEFVHHYFSTHTKLQNRFTHHSMTPDAHDTLVNLSTSTSSRIIGYTEMKKLQAEDYAISLSSIVYTYVTNNYKDLNVGQVLLSLYETASSELPWHGLISIIHNAGQLAYLIRYLSKKSKANPPACQENPTSASPYIGYAIWIMIQNGDVPLFHSVMSYKPSEQVIDELNVFSEIVRWKIIKDQFIPMTEMWKPGCTDVKLKTDITRIGLYLCALDITGDSIKDIISQSSENEFSLINFGEHNDLDLDMLLDTIDDDDSDKNKMYRWMKAKFPSWDWDEVEEDVHKGDINADTYDGLRVPLESIRVQIGISDLASCILTIRSSGMDEDTKDGSASSSADDSRLQKHPDEIFVGGKTGNRTTSVIEIPADIQYQEQLMAEYPDLDFTHNKIVLDQAHSHRLYGSSTTSQTKLDHVFSLLRINKRLPVGITITCLADGLGGFVEYLSTCTCISHFHFNTLPPRMGANCRPHSAEDSIRLNKNTVEMAALDEGYFDLTERITILELAKHATINDIVTNDADIKWGNISDTKKIWENTAEYFLSTGHSSSLLVMKVNVALIELLASVVSTLRVRCIYVSIVRCIMSNIGGECYLIAHGVITNHNLANRLTFITSDRVAMIINNFACAIQVKFTNVLAHQPEIPLWISLKRQHRTKMPDLNCAASQKMMSRMNVDCDIKRICEEGPSKYDIVNSIRHMAQGSMDNALASAKGENQYFKRMQSFSQDTLMHKMHMAMTFLTAFAFTDVLRVACLTNMLSKTYLRQSYGRALDVLPRYFPFVAATKDHYKRDFKVNNNRFVSPYMRFMDGVRLAQMVVGYVSQVAKPRMYIMPQAEHDKIFEKASRRKIRNSDGEDEE